MRVGIDARHLPEGRGVARYLQRTLAALAQRFPDDQWVALVPGRAPVTAPAGVELVRTRLPGRVLFGAGAVAGRPTLQRLLGGRVDVVWLPAPAPVALGPGMPYVLTVHDLSFEQRPADYTAYERLWHRAGRLGALARGARRVVAVSGPTRDAVIERWGVPAARVDVVHPGAGAVPRRDDGDHRRLPDTTAPAPALDPDPCRDDGDHRRLPDRPAAAPASDPDPCRDHGDHRRQPDTPAAAPASDPDPCRDHGDHRRQPDTPAAAPASDPDPCRDHGDHRRQPDRPGEAGGRPYLLFVGALEPRKAPELLAGAYARARAQGLDAELVLAGAGRLAPGLRDRPGMRLLGRVDGARLDALYRGALAVVLPSYAEGFGLPPLEALARGVPPVVSDLAVYDETLGAGALRFPPGDADALAAALVRIAADAGLRARLVADGRRAMAPLTWEATADGVHTALRRAIAPDRVGVPA